MWSHIFKARSNVKAKWSEEIRSHISLEVVRALQGMAISPSTFPKLNRSKKSNPRLRIIKVGLPTMSRLSWEAHAIAPSLEHDQNPSGCDSTSMSIIDSNCADIMADTSCTALSLLSYELASCVMDKMPTILLKRCLYRCFHSHCNAETLTKFVT